VTKTKITAAERKRRIKQIKAELKNKDAVRLWNENEKLKEANRILRDGLGYYANNCAMDDFQSDCCGDSARQALEQADKIMEGDEG
jgi:hypothetical protein